jgi:hypothetical protein
MEMTLAIVHLGFESEKWLLARECQLRACQVRAEEV